MRTFVCGIWSNFETASGYFLTSILISSSFRCHFPAAAPPLDAFDMVDHKQDELLCHNLLLEINCEYSFV